MLPRFRPAWSGLLLCLLAAATSARASIVWGEKGGVACEPPSAFYSSRHQAGMPPCCPTDDGVCPGGNPCPASGVCAVGGTKCAPTSVARPNVVLMISDDQGECHYGSARECRSVQTGTPIPAPATPALDALVSTGTVFAVAHNTASWCYPSLNSILTGRYQKSFGGFRSQIADRFLTIPKVLRNLGEAAGTTVDPFDPEARIGGYCTLQGGKFTASSGRHTGFDARVDVGERRLGRIECAANPKGGAPLCGTEMQPGYDPLELDNMHDLFEFMDGMVYKRPTGAQGEYAMQQFFTWYAPRIPHQPLRSPTAIGNYLFGADGRTGIFQLGQLCSGGVCPSMVRAFDENNFGTVKEYYGNVFLVDSNLREIRTFLQKLGAPHCRSAAGRARFGVATAQECGAGWASSVTPSPDQNTIIVYLSDNGWQLPNSKHNFSENGYRTRIIVNDPRNPTSGFESDALAHSTDLLPSILGFALDTPPGAQACPTSDFDGTPCDGRDFRAQLGGGAQGAAPASALRRSMCGHETRRPVRPSRGRYLLTGPGTVGRCALPSGGACKTTADCADGSFCLGGQCTADGGKPCASNAACPAGTACIGNVCQAGPPCIDDGPCKTLLGPTATCVDKTTKWCANAPDVACTTAGQCPECPSVNGRTVPCRRQCLARSLKLYDNGGRADVTDLFLDPDEHQIRSGVSGSWGAVLSDPTGPYADTIKRLVCCIDDWWPGDFRGLSLCENAVCPSDLACNQ